MPKRTPKNTWKTLSTQDIYENPWIKLEEHQVINPSGERGIYGKVHFKNTAIGVLAIDRKKNLWLVGQHRYTLNAWSWEIPEGGGAPDESPLAAAKRELKEETGLTARKWTKLLKTHLSNSVCDEVGFLYLAEDLHQGPSEPETSEADMRVWKLPFRSALKMVTEGKITDSLSIMAILTVARKLKIS